MKRTSPICWTCSLWLMAVPLIVAAHAADWRRVRFAPPSVNPPVRTIPHIANGAGWRTTVILVNTGTQAANFDLKFWDNNGKPLVLDLGPDGITADLSGVIQPGVARFIRSTGSGADLQTGWAELTAPNTVDGNAIFGLQSPGQGDSEAAVPLGPTGGNDLFVPFDYSPGYSTGIAFANPVKQVATVSAAIHDDSGNGDPSRADDFGSPSGPLLRCTRCSRFPASSRSAA